MALGTNGSGFNSTSEFFFEKKYLIARSNTGSLSFWDRENEKGKFNTKWA